MAGKNFSKVQFAAIVLATGLAWGATARDAHAHVHVSLLGGINETLSPTANKGLGYTGGAEAEIGGRVSLSVGAEYLSRPFTVTVTVGPLSASATGTVSYMHFPALVYFNIVPMVSIGAGGFYDAALSSGAPANYGASGALRIKFGMSPVFIAGRYNYGFNSSGWGGNTNDIQGLLGLMF